MKSLHGTVITDGKTLEDHVVTYEDDHIVSVQPKSEFKGEAEKVEGYIVPGFVDIHNHGGYGGDFPSGDETASRKAVDFHHRSGSTSIQASTVTADKETLLSTLATMAKLAEEELIEGIHLEGPFISIDKCGAQDPRYIIEPDMEMVDEMVKVSKGYLNTMTYAPEKNGAHELVKHLIKNDVTPSLGHTSTEVVDAITSLETIAKAYEGTYKVPTTTHTFNAMPPINHRDPGPIPPCMSKASKGNMVLELIADGTHINLTVIKAMFDSVGAENIALITDAMAAAGLKDGEYKLGPQDVIVKDSVARLKRDGAIAGGTSTLHSQIQLNAKNGMALEELILSATAVPARIIEQSRKLERKIGTLSTDAYADIVILDKDLELRQVIRRGKELDLKA
ncbi:MAG: amidohydrolase family protein [Micrococcaceae bacterium]